MATMMMIYRKEKRKRREKREKKIMKMMILLRIDKHSYMYFFILLPSLSVCSSSTAVGHDDLDDLDVAGKSSS